MPASLLPQVLLAFAAFLVPGVGLCVASRLTIDRSSVTALALAFGMGTAAIGLGSLVLVLLGVFGAVSLAVWWVALVAIAWVVAIRHGVLRRHLDGWRDHARADPWATAGVAVTVAGIALVRWSVAPVANLAPTVLRYWADALEIADAGRIPKGTLQWGLVIPPTTSKVVLNAFNAGASLLFGRDPIAPTGVLLFVVSIGLVVVTIALFRELGIVHLAPVGAILLFANGLTGSEFTKDLGFDLAEDWGRLVGFSAVLVTAIVFARSREGPHRPGSGDRPWFPGAIAAAGLLAASAGTHLIAASVAIAMVCALALASVVVWRRSQRFLVPAAVVLGGGIVLGTAILAIPRGDLGFEGAGGNARYQELREQLGLPDSFDPTRFIVTHDVEASSRIRPLTFGDVGEAFAYRAIGQRSPHGGPHPERLATLVVLGPIVLAFVLATAGAVWGPRDLRVVMLWAVSLALALFAVGTAFAVRYDLYALEAFGDRRLFTYALLSTVVIAIAGGEWALRAIGAGRGRVTAAAGLAIVLLSTAIFLPRATWAHAEDRPKLDAQLRLLRWVGDHVPCEGRVLANRRTLGTFESIAERSAVVEGMGPHIRPSVLARAIEEIFRARAFFRDPVGHARFLEQRGVAAVMVATPGNPFGGYPAMQGVRMDRLAQMASLHEAYHDPAGTVYLVRGFRPNPSLPVVSGRPGFGCSDAG